ncbi:MAG TPA: DUF5666 domain-containing protein [Candidatus Paceibacterota bacterium]|nr:DUF5666 domain-containing protein [Candidatus Paceibacterota bacterium]
MKKINICLASSTAALLLAAAPMLASAHNDSNNSGKGGIKADVKSSMSLNMGANIQHVLFGTPLPSHATTTANGSINTSATVTAINGSTLTVNAKGGTTYTVNAANATFSNANDTNVSLSQVKVGDTLRIKGTVNGSTITAEKISDDAARLRTVLSANGAAGAGVVTSVNGSILTIKPYGTKATTTVTTNASTVYRVNGDLASSSAVTVGSNVVIAGNTNADTSIAASIVGIFTRGFGFFKHILFH